MADEVSQAWSGASSTSSKMKSGRPELVMMRPQEVKLNEIFQLEEITHFTRTNNGGKKLTGSRKLVSFQEEDDDNDDDDDDDQILVCAGGMRRLNLNVGAGGSMSSPEHPQRAIEKINGQSLEVQGRDLLPGESDLRRSFYKGNNGSNNSGTCGSSTSTGRTNGEEIKSEAFHRVDKNVGHISLDRDSELPGTSWTLSGVRDDDGLFEDEDDGESGAEVRMKSDSASMRFSRMRDPFVVLLDVKRADVILDLIVFLTILGEFLTNVTMGIWHYRDGMRWAFAVTGFFILLGAGSVLHQFNKLQEPDIKRIFGRGKLIRILVNCFIPLTTILSSLRCVQIGLRATRDPMISSQYLEVEDLAKTLYKTQSVFQSAPLATVQLVILIEELNSGSISLLKAFVTLTNIVLAWTVMTNANLPSKVEDNDQVKKVNPSPSRRLYIGVRMFSSFASRTMAVTSLLVSSRCLLGPLNEVRAVVLGCAIIVLPRVIFFLVTFIRERTVGRRRSGAALGIGDQQDDAASCCQTFMGYLGTVLFPVGHPIWVFWYIWAETALLVILGNILGWSRGCLENTLNAVYTGIFLVLFIIIPILVPLVHDTARQRRIRNAENFFQQQQRQQENRNSDKVPPPAREFSNSPDAILNA